MIFNCDLSNIKRKLPKRWEVDVTKNQSTTNGLIDLSTYVMHMHRALLDIKQYYEEDFNNDNTYSIDDYISLFNLSVKKINKLLLNRYNAISSTNKDYEFDVENSFCTFMKFQYRKLNKKAFVFDKNSLDMYGFTDETYEKLLPLVNKIFMIEKMCSFTTRKFWEKEITKIENFEPEKPYKIIVRVITPMNWRSYDNSIVAHNYFKNKIYTSASLIDEQTNKNLINYAEWSFTKAAILILAYDNNSFVCAKETDTYSEEYINKEMPPIGNADFYSSVNLVDEEIKNDNLHEFFSKGLEIATPKAILENVWNFTEVDMKNPKVVGVISPNKKSTKYAKQFADEYNVPLYNINMEQKID